MPAKLATTVKKIDLVPNRINSDLINKFYEFMKSNGVSERHQNNNLKAVINFANFIGTFQKLLTQFESWGIRIYGLLDKDRNTIITNCNKVLRERLFVLERTCLENYILDSNNIYEELKVLAAPMLDKLKIDSAEKINDIIEEIITSENFFRNELETRLDEEISFHINIKNSQTEVNKIESLIDSVVESKKQRLFTTIERQRNLITEIINNRRYTDLNGKIIFGFMASKFGLDRDMLVKVTADKLAKSGMISPDLYTLISKFK